MTDIEIDISTKTDWARIEAAIESHCRAAGLRPVLKGALKKYPGSIHWHFKPRQKCRGTLEITLWPENGRAWFSIRQDRTTIWVKDIIPKLKTSIESSSERGPCQERKKG